MVISNTIKNAIRDWLQVKINECYRKVTNDTIDMFKFETNWFYEDNLFKQYDPVTGKLIKGEDDEPIRYIPCAVQSITGERRDIPNTYMADISVPVAMLVFDLDSLDSIEATLTYFADVTLGNVYTLSALYENKMTEYQFSLSVDLPDFDEFYTLQGQNGKAVVIMLTGVLTQGVKYGNDKKYLLSIDGGTTYEELMKTENSAVRVANYTSDQKLGDYAQKAIETDTVWNLNLTIMVKENNDSVSASLLDFIDVRDYKLIKMNGVQKYSVDPLNNLKLKIQRVGYNDIVKDVIISRLAESANYGDFVLLTITFLDKDTLQ